MLKKLMLIVNPVSGKGLVKGAMFDILSALQESYVSTVYITRKPGDARMFAATYGGAYDLVVCTGGDGTLSDVLSGLMEVQNPPSVGYIPMGTANDMATSLKLSRNPKIAASQICTGTPIAFDVGKLGEQYFSYIAAFGAFTEVSYSTPQETKRALGHLAYILQGMASLPTVTGYHATVEHDNGTVEGDFIFGAVSNSTSVAGLVKLDPNLVSLGDGLFEIILIRNPQNIVNLNEIISKILRQDYSSEHIVFLHTSKARFQFDRPVAWTRDGENGGTYEAVTIENCNRPATLIIPNGV